MKKLIIVESPGKIKTINKFAGNEYTVQASVGHIKDLPKKEMGIDVDDGFKCKFVINDDKKDVVSNLKKASKEASEVYLATDPDREGECIAQHLAEELKLSGKCRITFNEITKTAIQNALNNPREINKGKVDAQNARRILDRLVGYKISPVLWRKVAPKTSAGRVQSAALLLIANKEREIRRFVSRDYWTINVSLNVDGEEIAAQVVDSKGKVIEFDSKQEAEAALEKIKTNKITFGGKESKTTSRSPYAPFITSSLQQGCSSFFKMAASQTMQFAQKLYEGIDVKGMGQTALITYMRTDSFRSAPEAISAVRSYIADNYDSDYQTDKALFYGDKKKGQQDAHEAIRPTHIDILPEDVASGPLKNVYDLIWRRFVASQMADAQIEQTRLKFKAGDVFIEAKGSRIVFDGFLKVYPIQIDEQVLPEIASPKNIKTDKIENKEHQTQPPKRYSEAQLIKTLEKEGIGRPSTYATIIKTIVDRGYVKKENGSFHLTEMGLLVNDSLQKGFADIISLQFTSQMEENLDRIESGDNWKEVIKLFYDNLKESLKKANKDTKALISTNISCSACKNTMVLKYGANGRFLACNQYPKCKTTKDIPDDIDILAWIDSYLETGITIKEDSFKTEACPKCEAPLLRRNSRFGSFWGCSAYPECKYTRNIVQAVGPCLACKEGEIVEKKSKTGKFYACNKYPDCSRSFPSKPILDKKCEGCQDYLITHKKKEICSNKECKEYTSTYVRKTRKSKSDG